MHPSPHIPDTLTAADRTAPPMSACGVDLLHGGFRAVIAVVEVSPHPGSSTPQHPETHAYITGRFG